MKARLLYTIVLLAFISCQSEEKKVIVCWGDSLTAPHKQKGTIKGLIKSLIIGDNSYPSVFNAEIGEDDYEVINCGVGGENTTTIMARQGSAPMFLAHDVTIYNGKENESEIIIGNYDLPAFYSTRDSSLVKPLLQCGWDNNSPAHINPVNINNHQYQLKSKSKFWREDGKFVFSYTYYIEPLDETDKTYIIPQGSIIETQASKTLRNAYANIFFIGQNGGFKDIEDYVSQIEDMIKYSNCDKYIVISFHKKTRNLPKEQMPIMENALHSAFGKHYINLREYMVNSGLKDANLQPTQEDIQSIAVGDVPPQLLTDGVHFTKDGYKLIGKLVAKKFKELGYQ